MKTFALTMASVIVLSAVTLETANAQSAVYGWRRNAAGGVSAGSAHDRVGNNGGQVLGARGVVSDGEGDAVAGSANCASGAQGEACRAGYTSRSANGAVTHQSGAQFQAANGAKGTTKATFTRNLDGTYSGSRTTNVSGANGAYSGQTAYSSTSGVTHTATCTNSSGAVVACPTR